MTTAEAANKCCPFDMKYHCQAVKCMAWQSTGQDEGFCQMVSRSRTMFIASASPVLRIALEDAVRLKTEEPLEVKLMQGEYDCLEIRVKE